MNINVQGSRSVVLGLGSLIQSDDAVGVLALRKLEQVLSNGFEAEFIEGGTKGLDLLAYVQDAKRLLILDGVDVGEPPGTIVRLTAEGLDNLRGKGSAHEMAVADLLIALRMMGQEPDEIVFLGVQVEKVELGTSLSLKVERALPALVDAAIQELEHWH